MYDKEHEQVSEFPLTIQGMPIYAPVAVPQQGGFPGHNLRIPQRINDRRGIWPVCLATMRLQACRDGDR